MTKELEKTLKFLSKVSKKGKYDIENLYHNRIFVHNDIMYATEGHMMAVCKNLTEAKDFAYFEGKNFDFVKVENLEDTKNLSLKFNICEYTAYMLLFICMAPELHKRYMQKSIDDKISFLIIESNHNKVGLFTINKKNSDDYIVMKKYTGARGWDIIDFHIDNVDDCDILKRAKSYRDNVSVFLNENSSEELINFFKKHNIRVKMQINFDYE